MKSLILKTIALVTVFQIVTIIKIQAGDKSDTAAYNKIQYQKSCYYNAKAEIEKMFSGEIPLSYERAIFLIENAYLNNEDNYNGYTGKLDFHVNMIKDIYEQYQIQNPKTFTSTIEATAEIKKARYDNALKNWAIYKYMTDTIHYIFNQEKYYSTPLTYSVQDPMGSDDWSNTQVITLLNQYKKSGNCLALASLFKIYSDRLNSGANLVTAPNHIYIQHKDPQDRVYSIELATRSFPGSGSLQTITYTTDDAVDNGIAMRSLDSKQSVALCLVYLAKGYEHKFNVKADDFMMGCAELALKHDSKNLNAMLLKAEILEERIITEMNENGINEVAQLKNHASLNIKFKEYEKFISNLYSLGYREMPLEMKNLLISTIKRDNAPIITIDHTPRAFPNIKGNNEKVITLSNGLFDEEIKTKGIEKINKTVFDTKIMQVKSFETETPLYNNYNFDPVVFALSVDPLSHQFSSWSPYVAFNDNPIFYIDPDGKKVKASNDLALTAIQDVFKQFEAYSRSGKENLRKQDVANLFNLQFDKDAKTYSAAGDKMSFKTFRKNASKHFDFSKKELKEAYGVYLKVQSSETVEVEAWEKQTPSSTRVEGQEGSVVVPKIEGFSRQTTNPELNKALVDLKADNPGTIDKIFNPNDPTYNVDDRGSDWVQFRSTSNQTKGIYIIKAAEKMGETLKDALIKDAPKKNE